MEIELTRAIHVKRANGYLSGKRASGNDRLMHIIRKCSHWSLNRISRFLKVKNDLYKSKDYSYIDQSDQYKSKDYSYIDQNLHTCILTKIVKGERNTPKYIEVLERVWLLPISEIREIYKRDLEREPTFNERIEFLNYYNKILSDAKKDGRYIKPY
jgi:hypothetical protein